MEEEEESLGWGIVGSCSGGCMRTAWSSSTVVVARRDQHSNAAAIAMREDDSEEEWWFKFCSCSDSGHVFLLTLPNTEMHAIPGFAEPSFIFSILTNILFLISFMKLRKHSDT